MTYCLAFSTEGVIDVSQGYTETSKWPETLKRRDMISEDELQRVGCCAGEFLVQANVL
jgi:hypothetical protein